MLLIQTGVTQRPTVQEKDGQNGDKNWVLNDGESTFFSTNSSNITYLCLIYEAIVSHCDQNKTKDENVEFFTRAPNRGHIYVLIERKQVGRFGQIILRLKWMELTRIATTSQLIGNPF